MRPVNCFLLIIACLLLTLPAWTGFWAGSAHAAPVAENALQPLPEDILRAHFTNYICSQLKKSKADVAISKFKVVGRRPLPKGKVSVRIFKKTAGALNGYVRLNAIIKVNGTVVNKIKLYGWVDVFEAVVVAAGSLKKGMIVGQNDFHMARKNISHLSDDILTDVHDAVGLMTKHTIQQGANIKKWMLEKAPIVERGDTVMILAESGTLRVTVPGIIMEKGFSGDLIKVQNTMSRKEIYARVVNGSIVKVDF